MQVLEPPVAPEVRRARLSAMRERRRARVLAELANFDKLPNGAHVDVHVAAGILDLSATHFWRLLAGKKVPEPVYLGERATRWNVGKLREHIAAAKDRPHTAWRCPPKKEASI